ncbi:GNAT family N-acetyltransferase [Anatilimnocola floriformis]|uniref:GNAT family N-acetyltransferase n=1 Tax=Anatilimnocola floriformis TaxID=2948575 RepID=UPI0020C326C7|nr:GNAT family N-acetyltransferase [Anatilimnocola floriformis]
MSSHSPPNISIRPVIEADLPTLYRIRTDPRVSVFQFRLQASDTLEEMKSRMLETQPKGDFTYRYTSLVANEEVVGYSTQMLYRGNGQLHCYSGWNVDPEHWGRGCAREGLRQVLDELFDVHKVQIFIADCFAGNARCLRLLQRLGFRRGSIPWLERLQTAWSFRCGHWIMRWYMTPDDWQRERNVKQLFG